MFVVAPGEEGVARVGLIVSRKVGNSVKRNRAKRRIRQAVAECSPGVGLDYVLIATPEVTTAQWADLTRWVREGMEARP